MQDAPFPLFDEVTAEHVVPGITQLLDELNAELDELEKKVQPTWSGLVEPLERLTDRLSLAWGTVSHLKVCSPYCRSYFPYSSETSLLMTTLPWSHAAWIGTRRCLLRRSLIHLFPGSLGKRGSCLCDTVAGVPDQIHNECAALMKVREGHSHGDVQNSVTAVTVVSG